jgi:methylthioribulose-1-phosphate dehydratase
MTDSEKPIDELIALGNFLYRQNWVLGTSGNFSTILSRDPFKLLMTGSGIHKGNMGRESFVVIDQQGNVLSGKQKPSAETAIHLAIISESGAGTILHTHSVWATILSEIHGPAGRIVVRGFEMLKGLSGVTTHQHEECLPILENSQDYAVLAGSVSEAFKNTTGLHGILLRQHGLYTWGRDIQEAARHVEILEFLFEVLGRQHGMNGKS